MRRRSWSKTLREFSRNLEDTWDDLVHDDTSQLEREFNRLIGRMQRRHGYSPDRALHELQNQWNNYSKHTRSLLDRSLTSWPIGRKQRRTRWPWILGAIFGLLYIGFALLKRTSFQNADHRGNGHRDSGYRAQSRTGTAQQHKSQQQTRQSSEEGSSVEERSWESFPASDPPATW